MISDKLGEKKSIPFKDRTTSEYLVTLIGGCLLAFNAGYLNGTMMEHNDASVTHVSGTATRTGRFIALEDQYKTQLNGGE